jgi:hypothetical protein
VVGIQGINGYIIYIIVSRRFSFAQVQLLLSAALLINFYMQFLLIIKFFRISIYVLVRIYLRPLGESLN